MFLSRPMPWDIGPFKGYLIGREIIHELFKKATK